MFDKRSQVQRTFFTVKHFPNSVDAAMPNKAPETGEWVCGVGVGVRLGLRGASVPRWSA